ncbi:MAG TPA: hypothetical protein VF530_17545 [Planctomycetota bacterium]
MRLTRSCPFLLLLAACHDSGGGGGGAPGLLTNHGVSGLSVVGRGELWLVRVREIEQGGLDRNGDGDTLDLVPAVLDLADGSLTDLGLAVSSSPLATVVGEVLIALGVPESAQGSSDLNGDGDALDTVLHVYDASTRTTTNTALAMASLAPAIGLGVVAFGVSESAQGATDLDGDGTATGNVLHVFDSRTGITTSAQRSITSRPIFHDHAFAFTTDEASAGADLNGDGDQDDTSILQTYDLVLGGGVSVPLAVAGIPLGALVEDWYTLADEAAQGQDLNGDLDLLDGVLLAVEPHLGSLQPTAITSFPSPLALSDGERLAVFATEEDGVDRNGDAVLDDTYAALIEPGPGTIFVADLPLTFAAQSLALTPHGVAFVVSEDEVGDRNGNGLGGESILHLMDAMTGTVTSIDLEALTLQAAGDFVVFARLETSGSIQEDRNGDGDVDDLVFSLLDTRTGLLSDTALAAGGGLVASAGALLIPFDELAQATDRNGDGDTADLVWVRHELATGVQTTLAASIAQVDGVGLADDGRGVLLVRESDHGPFPGTDLNGDGDTFDLVLHSFQAP